MPSHLHSAGELVDQSAEALAAGLLNIEQYAHHEIASHFTLLQHEASKAVLQSGNVFMVLDAALEASTITTHGLLVNATGLAVDATRREMHAIGEAINAPGGAYHAGGQAEAEVSAAVQRGLDTFNLTHEYTRRAFAYQLRTQILRAVDRADLQLRVFSPRPVAGIGLGVWYKPVGWLQAQARASTMGAVNMVKARGIAVMNENV